MGPYSPRKVSPGDRIQAQAWNDLNAEIRRVGTVSCGPGLSATSGPGGTTIARSDDDFLWIELTGPAGPDGGYPYKAAYMVSPLAVTAPGSGYTSAPTATLSGGGGSGATVAVSIDSDTGTVVAAKLTALGSGYTSAPTVALSGGGGTGGMVTFNNPLWQLWPGTGIAGDGLTDAAYEIRGVRSLPADSSVYLAMRNPMTGKLIFFCRPSMVVQTTTVTTYPTSAASYFAVKPCSVSGTETEGAGASITTYTNIFHALNLGSAVPNSGTFLVTTFVTNRWVFRYDG